MNKKEQITKEARERGLNSTEMKVLSIDPFFVGSEKDYVDAKWSSQLWDQVMAKRKKQLHLRGFHYAVMSLGAIKPNGEKYAHKDPAKDWTYLLHCAQMARNLGIGKWTNLVDLKHPAPSDYDIYWVGSGLAQNGDVDIQEELNRKISGLTDSLIEGLLNLSPKYHTNGYQTYHQEVWIEKQSMGMFIEPIVKRYKAVMQALVGQASVEKVNMGFKRCLQAARAGKKTRIWYISDDDRYGISMIPAVARKLEFFSQKENLDIKLTRLALTDEQVEKYKLPRAPKHGEAVVELDALEAIHPGELGKIIKGALEPYYDAKNPKLVEEENRNIRERVSQMLEDKVRNPLESMLASLELSNIDVDLTKAINNDFKLPEPEHKVNEDGTDWVYDSSRGYWKQFDAYGEYRDKCKEKPIAGVDKIVATKTKKKKAKSKNRKVVKGRNTRQGGNNE